MKRLAGDEEAIVRVEVVVKRVQIQVAFVAVPVEIGHIAVVIRVPPTRKFASFFLCRVSPFNTTR